MADLKLGGMLAAARLLGLIGFDLVWRRSYLERVDADGWLRREPDGPGRWGVVRRRAA